MGALADIFTAVRLTLDGTGFEAQATALATKSGQNAGTAMSQQISSKLKSAAVGAMGAAGGLALASAINGATKLNELAGDYQVQTGANAQQAKAFSGVLNDLFKNAHQSYDEIAATLIGLKTHFDMDGAAAKALAANILDFAEIAGGTGADAVERLNSLVKTGVIAQADMAATMDKLTLAHQTWGININETLDALTKFAPAMNAFGMTTDQAIAWMSIFNKAGVDSQRVVMGFNTALQKVKTPEEFNALVAKIAATPDALERAKLAVGLFGARAGGALANMLRPGTQSIADMAAVIGTDYTGAVEKAAAVNDNTFGGRALLMLHQFQGTLAEMGTNMGDLLMVFALLGPGLTKGLLAGLGGIGGLFAKQVIPQITGAILGATVPAAIAGGEVGTATGTAFGIAIGPALALAIPAAIVIGLTAAKPTIQKWLDDMGLKVPDLFQGQGALAPPGQIVSVGTQTTYAEGNAAAHEAAMKAAGASDAGAIAAGLASGAPQMLAASKDLGTNVLSGFLGPLQFSADKVAAIFGIKMQGVLDASKQTGADGMEAMAQGIDSARQKPLDAFDTLKTMLKNAMTPMAEVARIRGQLTSKELAAGLKSGDGAVRAQAIAVAKAAADRLGQLVVGGGNSGKQAMLALDQGIRSKIPEVSAASLAAKNAAVAQLATTVGPARTYGQLTGEAYSAAIAAGIAANTGLIRSNISKIGLMLKAKSPPGPESPLHEIDKWGQRTGQTWVDGLVGSIAGGKAGIMGALGGLAMPGVGGGSFGMPYAAPRMDFSAQSTRAGASVLSTRGGDTVGGPTYNIAITNPDPRAAEADIGRVLRRTAALGMAQ